MARSTGKTAKTVKCPVHGCNEVVERGDLSTHMELEHPEMGRSVRKPSRDGHPHSGRRRQRPRELSAAMEF